MSVIEQMRETQLPDYYDMMYQDGYKPWEIVEAAHRTMIKEYNRRME